MPGEQIHVHQAAGLQSIDLPLLTMPRRQRVQKRNSTLPEAQPCQVFQKNTILVNDFEDAKDTRPNINHNTQAWADEMR